jgi:hypothetical protein
MEQSANKQDEPAVLSYIALRRSIGILGILLPFVVWLGSLIFSECRGVQGSISDYYHTIMGNVLVGVLSAVALFLFTYRGYDDRDKIAGFLTAFFAICVAYFPTNMKGLIENCTHEPFLYFDFYKYVHLLAAALFFLTLSYISLFLFTLTEDEAKKNNSLFSYIFPRVLFNKDFTKTLDKPKKYRNRIYIICGFVMLFSIVAIVVYFQFLKPRYPGLVELDPIFWFEALALWAFGISWLTKGETLFRDKKKI